MDPQVIVIAGSNDHLQSRGLLSRLTDGSIPSNEVIGEAIMTLLSAMTEVEAPVQRHFTKNVVKIIFMLSPGYTTLPICVHDGQNSGGVTIQRVNTHTEQNSEPQLLLSTPL